MRTMFPEAASMRPITGRFVLLCILAFFGVVVAVNLTMVRFALTSFGGVETRNAYQAGLQFSHEIAEARVQKSRQFQIDVKIGQSDGLSTIELAARNEKGLPVSGAELIVTVGHPADRRQDGVIAAHEISPGIYRGKGIVQHGQRDLVIELFRDGQRIFRSKNRVLIQ
jgi:nitrogen fixation protein FixH